MSLNNNYLIDTGIKDYLIDKSTDPEFTKGLLDRAVDFFNDYFKDNKSNSSGITSFLTTYGISTLLGIVGYYVVKRHKRSSKARLFAKFVRVDVNKITLDEVLNELNKNKGYFRSVQEKVITHVRSGNYREVTNYIAEEFGLREDEAKQVFEGIKDTIINTEVLQNLTQLSKVVDHIAKNLLPVNTQDIKTDINNQMEGIKTILARVATSEDVEELRSDITNNFQITNNLVEQKFKRQEELIRKEEKAYEIPYIELSVKDSNREKIIEHIANAVDINLSEFKLLDFVPPDHYDDWNAKNKLLIRGIGGSGKSTIIAKIVQQKIDEQKNNNNNLNLEKIYVINPITYADSKRSTIDSLMIDTTNRDIVIWDNFPMGFLRRQNSKDGKKILETISSYNIKNLIVSLKEEYNYLYNKQNLESIPELYVSDITYDKQKIKKIVESYGEYVYDVNDVYKTYIQNEAEDITNILSKTASVPLTIHLFYKKLFENYSIIRTAKDVLKIAEEIKPPDESFKKEFDIVRSKSTKDVNFLYTIKLCYELGFERTVPFTRKLQKEIFKGDLPDEPEKKLSAWVQLLPNNLGYIMPDVARSAINYSEDKKPDIIKFIISNFKDYENSLQSVGFFLGRNIAFILRGSTIFEHVLARFWEHIENNDKFRGGFCYGVANEFHSFDTQLQDEILEIADANLKGLESFCRSLSVILGTYLAGTFSDLAKDLQHRLLTRSDYKSTQFIRILLLFLDISSLDKEMQVKVLEVIQKKSGEEHLFFLNLINAFPKMDDDLQNSVIELAKTKKEIQPLFTITFNPSLLNPESQQKLLKKLYDPRIGDFGYCMAYPFSSHFKSLDGEIQNTILKMANEIPPNDQNLLPAYHIVTLLPTNFAQEFPSYSKELRSKIFEFAETHDVFARFILGRSFHLKPQNIDKDFMYIVNLSRKSESFLSGLGFRTEEDEELDRLLDEYKVEKPNQSISDIETLYTCKECGKTFNSLQGNEFKEHIH